MRIKVITPEKTFKKLKINKNLVVPDGFIQVGKVIGIMGKKDTPSKSFKIDEVKKIES